jgi:hypothetical protein
MNVIKSSWALSRVNVVLTAASACLILSCLTSSCLNVSSFVLTNICASSLIVTQALSGTTNRAYTVFSSDGSIFNRLSHISCYWFSVTEVKFQYQVMGINMQHHSPTTGVNSRRNYIFISYLQNVHTRSRLSACVSSPKLLDGFQWNLALGDLH